MTRLISISIALVALLLAGCETMVASAFVDYPPIANGQGQLVIFSQTKANSKLRFSGQVECSGVLCARVIHQFSPNGVYSVHSLTPRDVVIKAPGKKSIPFVGEALLDSNSLTVKVEPGKRTVVMVTLLGGSEIHSSTGQVGNVSQTYRIELISEQDALPMLKGLTELKFKEALN